jgi:mRNA-degrading endonuclease toxin of MazEF toxin-antitoxin module
LPAPDAGQPGTADKVAVTPPKASEAGAVVAVVPVTETPAPPAKSDAEPAPIQAVLAVVQTDANGKAAITVDQVAALQELATEAPQVVHKVKVAPGLQTDADPLTLGLLTMPATTSPEVVMLPADATPTDQAPMFVLLPQPDAIL